MDMLPDRHQPQPQLSATSAGRNPAELLVVQSTSIIGVESPRTSAKADGIRGVTPPNGPFANANLHSRQCGRATSKKRHNLRLQEVPNDGNVDG